MTSSSDNSFIPKRGPVKRKQTAATRQVYIFTYISYILMFATLLATGGVYLYGQFIDRQLDNEIAALNTEISSFSGENLARVTEFDLRLQQASLRLDNSVSIVSVFEALQAATIGTVQIVSLDMVRQDDEKFVLNASVETDSFDSTIFQRGVFGRSDVISEEIAIESVVTDTQADVNTSGDVLSTRPVVTFTAVLEVPVENVPYVPSVRPQIPAPLTITQPAVEDELDSVNSAGDVADSNNDSL